MTETTATAVHVQAVLFDQDGTLLTSLEATERAWHGWAQVWCPRFGVDPATFHVIHGQPAVTSVRSVVPPQWEAEALADIDARELGDLGGITWEPGAREAIDSLPPSRWTIVTSCRPPLTDARLAAIGLAVPPHRVTVDDVEHGKPAPDPYLLAAQRMGVAPRDALVVEDSPGGVVSGARAGCRLLALGAAARAARDGTLQAQLPAGVVVDLAADDLSDVEFLPDDTGVTVRLRPHL